MNAGIYFFRHKALTTPFPSCHIHFKLTFNDSFLILPYSCIIGTSALYWMTKLFQLQASVVQSQSLSGGKKQIQPETNVERKEECQEDRWNRG